MNQGVNSDIYPCDSICCRKNQHSTGGFTDGLAHAPLTVDCARSLLERIPADSREGLLGVLAGDPRPRYQEDPRRVYGLAFAGYNIRFTVDGDRLTVVDVEEA